MPKLSVWNTRYSSNERSRELSAHQKKLEEIKRGKIKTMNTQPKPKSRNLKLTNPYEYDINGRRIKPANYDFDEYDEDEVDENENCTNDNFSVKVHNRGNINQVIIKPKQQQQTVIMNRGTNRAKENTYLERKRQLNQHHNRLASNIKNTTATTQRKPLKGIQLNVSQMKHPSVKKSKPEALTSLDLLKENEDQHIWGNNQMDALGYLERSQNKFNDVEDRLSCFNNTLDRFNTVIQISNESK